jgi:hypothetical protein
MNIAAMRFGFTIRIPFLLRRLTHLAPALPQCTWFSISAFASLLTPVKIHLFFFSFIFIIYLHKFASLPLPLTPIQASLALFAFACVPEQDLGCVTDLKQNSDSIGRGNSFALAMLSFLSCVVGGSRFKCVAATFTVSSNISNLMACFVAGVNLHSPFV